MSSLQPAISAGHRFRRWCRPELLIWTAVLLLSPSVLGQPTTWPSLLQDREYTAGQSITPLILPPATGVGAPTYSLTATTSDGTLANQLPAGLSFATGSRTLSGTPTAAGTYRMTYSAASTGGNSVEATFNVVVHPAPALAWVSLAEDVTLQAGQYTEWVLPAATGGIGALSYSVDIMHRGGVRTFNLPPGLEFDAATRTLSGRPELGGIRPFANTPGGQWRIFYRVQDSSTPPDSRDTMFTITVQRNPAEAPSAAQGEFAERPEDQTYTGGQEIRQLVLPEIVGGAETTTYSLEATNDPLWKGVLVDGLPAGLDFDATTRTLSGAPRALGRYNLTYRATLAGGATRTASFKIFIRPQEPLANAVANQAQRRLRLGPGVYRVGEAVGPLQFPELRGEQVRTVNYSLQSLRQYPSGGWYYWGLSVPGLSFDTRTRTLSGTPTAAGRYRMAYFASVANSGSSGIVSESEFNIRVLGFASELSDQDYRAGEAITPLVLPFARGQNGTATYSLTATATPGGSLTNELPAGLSFAADTRTLSGTPTAPGTYRMTFSFTDRDSNTVTATFNVVVRPPAVSPPNVVHGSGLTNWQYMVGEDPVALVLPAATGGLGDLTYSLQKSTEQGPVEQLPAGWEFNADTRTLSGDLATVGFFSFMYRAEDIRGYGANAYFFISVSEALSLESPSDQNYPVDTAIADLVLPEATGGFGAQTYRLASTTSDGTVVNNLPAGLSFAADSRTLSGTPTAAGTYEMTLTATDNRDNSAQATFNLVVEPAPVPAPELPEYLHYLVEMVGVDIGARVLPAATGGVGDLTYSLHHLSGQGRVLEQLPAGLEFAADTRTLSGTPTTAGLFAFRYRAEDTRGSNADALFWIAVSEALSLESPSDQNYPVDTAIDDLVLPQATGGIGDKTYSLSSTTSDGTLDGDLPAGLSFAAGTLRLSGTPTAVGTYEMTLTATDIRDNSVEATFNLVVEPPAAEMTFASLQAHQYFGVNQDMAPWTLPEATGAAGTPSYSLTATASNGGALDSNGELPAGLSFNPDTRTVSGRPTAAGSYAMTFTATDSASSGSVSQQFSVVVYERPQFRSLIPALWRGGDTSVETHLIGTTFADRQFPAATGGYGTLTYSLSGSETSQTWPAGLSGVSFDANTRTLSGNPTTPGNYLLRYVVTDERGNRQRIYYRLLVHRQLTLPSTLSEQSYLVGEAIAPLQLPQSTNRITSMNHRLDTTTSDGTLTRPYFEQKWPAGLEFNTETRTLSGTPTAPGTYQVTYSVFPYQLGVWLTEPVRRMIERGAGLSATFELVVHSPLSLSSSLRRKRYRAGQAIDELVLPQATGGVGDKTYSLTATTDNGTLADGLPAGLSFAADTRTLSGTPTVSGRYEMTYRATDEDDGSVQGTFRLVVRSSGPLDLPAIPERRVVLQVDEPAEEVVLPAATGGVGALRYSLDVWRSSSWPAGLEFDAATRTISGTPTVAGHFSMLYVVYDSRDVGRNTTFTIVVQGHFAETPDDKTYTGGREMQLVLPEVVGGSETTTYSLVATTSKGRLAGQLPAGLTFDAASRTLSGTPTALGPYSMTYEATFADGATRTARFTIFVNPESWLSDTVDNKYYRVGQAISPLELPEFRGEQLRPVVYQLLTKRDPESAWSSLSGSELPAGLSFSPSTRTLSGTPTAPGTWWVLYNASIEGYGFTGDEFVIRVLGFPAAPSDQYYDVDEAIAPLVLPEATGIGSGGAPLSYTLTAASYNGGSVVDDLPAGLSFAADTRTLSGTPTATGIYEMTLTATTSSGNRSVQTVFLLVVEPDPEPLSWEGPLHDKNILTSWNLYDTVQLPAASGGVGDKTYSLIAAPTAGSQQWRPPTTGALSGELPAGLSFDAERRMLRGRATAPGTYEMIYAVTDDTATALTGTFALTVLSPVSLPTPDSLEYRVGEDIGSVVLPAGSGASGHLNYGIRRRTTSTDFILFQGPTSSWFPPGLSFDARSRTLSGTLTEAGTYHLVYSAGDGHTATNTFFDLVVEPAAEPEPLAWDSEPDDIRRMAWRGAVQSDRSWVLPQATGGVGDLTYSLEATSEDGVLANGLPAGFSFAADTRTLLAAVASGPMQRPGLYSMTYRVTDEAENTATATFDLILHAEPRFDGSVEDHRALVGTPMRLVLPAAVGEARLGQPTYIIWFTLWTASDEAVQLGRNTPPAGLEFDPTARTLSGTPEAAGDYLVAFVANYEDGPVGAFVTEGFELVVEPAAEPLEWDAQPADVAGIPGMNFEDLVLPAATGGVGDLTYSLTATSEDGTLVGGLPSGLRFAADTRTLSNPDPGGLDRPGQGLRPGTYSMTWTVTDSTGDNSATATFDVVIYPFPAWSSLPNDPQYVVGDEVELQLPAAVGAAGLGAQSYYLLATSSDGTVDDDLPAGLSFAADTRTLSGTPTAAGTYRVSASVIWPNFVWRPGSTGFAITEGFDLVVRPALSLPELADRDYQAGEAIDELTLPQATGGIGTTVYSLRHRRSSTDNTVLPGLPAGLDFDPVSRTLSGTPTTAGTYHMVYWANGQNSPPSHGVSEYFTLVVYPPLSLELTYSGVRTYVIDYPRGVTLRLPEATGGLGDLTYSLVAITSSRSSQWLPPTTGVLANDLPAGLEFDAGTRTLSGRATDPGSYSLTYGVTDEGGNSVIRTFEVIFFRGRDLVEPVPTNREYLVGKAIEPVELPAATGGSGHLAYSLRRPPGEQGTRPALPAGLTFDANTRTVSGTPTETGRYEMYYWVVDERLRSGSAEGYLDWVVKPALALGAAPSDQEYLAGQAIDDLVLPEATGGVGNLTYSLTGDLPAGLEFAADTRTLSGTPTAAGTFSLTWRATDTRGNSVEVAFNVVVSSALALSRPGDQVWPIGAGVDLELPAASGGIGNLKYRLVVEAGSGATFNALPAGLGFAADSRTLSGRPTTAGRYSMAYSATDSEGNSVTETFNVLVHAVLAMDTPSTQRHLVGGDVELELPQATGGVGDLTYELEATTNDGTLADGLPAGLNFAADSRTLSGSPTAAGTYSLSWSVSDSGGNEVEAEFALVVHPALSLAAPDAQQYVAGTDIGRLDLPQATGGIGTLQYRLVVRSSNGAVFNALPAGLVFAADTRRLTGAPTTAGSYNMAYSATDSRNNSVEVNFNLEVLPALALTAPQPQQYLVGSEVQLVLPEATGGSGNLTYDLRVASAEDTVIDGLPAGLSFAADSRTLSGSPPIIGTYEMSYSVADDRGGSATATFDLVVRPQLALIDAPDNKEYLIGSEVGLDLPTATGGIGEPRYSLTARTEDGILADELPAGLEFDAEAAKLSGTPTAAGTYRLTFSATDDEETSVQAGFVLVVYSLLSLDSPLGDQEYMVGKDVELELPAASGGIGEPTYSLTAEITDGGTLAEGLPAGLEFDPDTRKLVGTPTAAGTYTLTWRVTDEKSNRIGWVFRVLVLQDEAPAFVAGAQPGDQHYLIGSPATQLVLPAATGGNGTLVYELEADTQNGQLANGLPAGLDFNPFNRILSGSPTAIGNYRMTYSATDADGDKAVLQFTVLVLDEEVVAAAADGEIRQSSALALAGSIGQSMAYRMKQFAAGDLLASTVTPDGSSLSLPLSNSANGPTTQADGGLAFWLQTSQQQLENRSGLLFWDGEVEETRIGLDGRVGNNVLLGLMMSRSEGSFDYNGMSGALVGTHENTLELIGPYFGWTGENGLHLSAILSRGRGQIGTPTEAPEEFDVSMGMLGLDYRLLSGQVSDLRLRAELSSLDVEYGNSDAASVLGPAALSETWQLRLVAETSHSFRTPGGASWTPSWQLAFRDSNYEQALGTGLEIGGSLGYRSSDSRFTVEVGGRMLDAETAGYKETGSYLLLRLQTSPDKRGLSLSLSPTRGQVASKIEEIWDRQKHTLLTDLAAASRTEDTSEAEKMVGELGYGIAWGTRFLLTPYSKFGWSEDNRTWAFGTRWETGKNFTISLEGHGEESGQSEPTHGIRLQGKLDF